MIIKRMAFGNKNESFIEDRFTKGLNIISSDDNNKGKTIVIQSMMYALGNEPTFPTSFDYKECYHYIEFEVSDKCYKLCRFNDSFILKNQNTLIFLENVSELKRYWKQNIFDLPEIIKNQILKIVDPVLFIQIHFAGQDKKDTSNIANHGYYNKNDFWNMIYSYLDYGDNKLNIEEIEQIKDKLISLKNERKLLIKEHEILSSTNIAAQYVSSVNDKIAFENKVNRIKKINSKITEIRNQRTLNANRKSKWENTIKELNSLNRNIDSGELKCMDCNSTNISFTTSTKHNAYTFEVSTIEMRKEIIASIKNKIVSYEEEIEKLDNLIQKEQENLQDVLNDEEISLESVLALKKQYFSAEDAEKRILKIDEEIGNLQNQLKLSELSINNTKEQRDLIKNKILKEMNDIYREIDPTGNLSFDDIFTKKDETFSGSEATIFHIIKLYALKIVLKHDLPIIIDSFRAEDLSTQKESIVIKKLSNINNQSILTTTLKNEEIGKYNNLQGINHIDYSHNKPSKILSNSYVDGFNDLLKDFSINIFNENIK